jgi:hypothetical protein
MSINPPAGQPTPLPTSHIDTEPAVHDHVDQPRQDGASRSANRAGTRPARIRTESSRRRETVTDTATTRLPTVRVLPRSRVDAGGSRLRLRALHVMGHGSARIARTLGVRESAIQQLVRGDAATVSPRLRDAITNLYEAWWDKRAPERTPAQRGAATVARRRAIAGNWCAGAGLDDDLLDTPGYRPSQGWKPATGTGVASDTRPISRPRRRSGA